MMHEFGFGFGFSPFMMVGGILFYALVILGVYYIIRSLMKSKAEQGSHPANDALNILNERYARGEIDEEDYQRRKAELKKL